MPTEGVVSMEVRGHGEEEVHGKEGVHGEVGILLHWQACLTELMQDLI